MRVTVFDYGAGNLHSLLKALQTPGVTIHIEPNPKLAVNTDVLVLPGVGAFSSAAACLRPGADVMRRAINDGLPCLGVCLGMQLLFDLSEEGPGRGLGVIPGSVRRLRASHVPQIGWNTLDEATEPVVAQSELRDVYYANSYVCEPVDERCVAAWSTHDDDRFVAVVRQARVLGVQFHPEKSSQPGVRMLHEFLREVRT